MVKEEGGGERRRGGAEGEGGGGGGGDGNNDDDDDDDPEGSGVEGGGRDGSGEESDEGDLKAEGELLQQHVHDAECGLQHYTDNLELLRGSCLLCRLLTGNGVGTEATGAVVHPLDACRTPNKYHFFDTKAQARQEGQRHFSFNWGGRAGWLSRYTACFGCGNFQNVCVRQRQGMGQCRYHDIVMPVCWAAYQREIWRKHTLPTLTKQSFSTELKYML